jgi:hypothetical protein
MAYSYSNTPPDEAAFEQLYSGCETYLVNETLPLEAIGHPDRKSWSKEQISYLSFHTQIIKDGYVICWFAGEKIDGLAKYSIALVSPDENGSRAYWYDVNFWNTVKAAHKNEQLNGWFADTLRGTSLHSTLTTYFEGRPHTEEAFITSSNLEVVTITMTYGDQ